MSTLYADTSVLLRAYLVDEPEHADLRQLLLEDEHPVLTSEIFLTEAAGAITRAHRASRVDGPALIGQVRRDCEGWGPIDLVPLTVRDVPRRAEALAERHALRALDAVHLAVCIEAVVPQALDEVVFVTRDDDQAAAARAEGLLVA